MRINMKGAPDLRSRPPDQFLALSLSVALRVGVHYVHGKINLRVAVQFAEATSSYSTKAVCCCAHSEQLNVSRSRPGVPVPLVLYSHIARPQLGHGGG